MKKEDKLILINHRINKSHLTIDDAKFSLENNKTSIALNRIYYSIFYIVSALALIYDFSTSKHKQLLGWFNKNF
ncbi:MAG: HEPN domain-containing protein, partial [FCB group bacterium]